MPRRRTTRLAGAFTYLELLIVLVVLAILVAILLPILIRMRESKNRQICAGQLRSIGQALQMYANDNKGAYPRTTHAPGTTVIPTWGTGAAATDPFGPRGPAPNDVTAALFLLIRTQDITPEIFTCPSTDQEKWDFGGGRNTALNWSNFSDVRRQLSYSVQNRYHSDGFEAAMRSRFMGWRGPSAEDAVASDMNPGNTGGTINVTTVTTVSTAKDMKLANSRNHNSDGQNVLYADGHVSFTTNPFVGIKRDNIFTTKNEKHALSGGPIFESPFDGDDSILLPTSQ
ncbi:MAG: hypothetical protein H7Z14_13375 [Anaerolineae bacterium]|nr:hypothetical protein [Phycisphaerae bacterium]